MFARNRQNGFVGVRNFSLRLRRGPARIWPMSLTPRFVRRQTVGPINKNKRIGSPKDRVRQGVFDEAIVEAARGRECRGPRHRHHPRLRPAADQDRRSRPRSSCRSGATPRTPPRWRSTRSTPRAACSGGNSKSSSPTRPKIRSTGIAAIKKLTADDKVDVLIGGYTSGVTLAQLPHISQAKTIYIGVGAASPAITAKVKADYDNYNTFSASARSTPRTRPARWSTSSTASSRAISNITKIAIVGENAKWVQDLVPLLKKGAAEAAPTCSSRNSSTPQTSDFSPLFAKVKDSGAQYLIVVLSHASCDIFAKQWYDSQLPDPDRRHRRQEPWTATSSSASAARQRRDRRQLRDARAADAEDRAVLRRIRQALRHLAGLYRVSAPTTPSTSMPRRSRAPSRPRPTPSSRSSRRPSYVGIPGTIEFDENHDVKAGPGCRTYFRTVAAGALIAQWSGRRKPQARSDRAAVDADQPISSIGRPAGSVPGAPKPAA